MSQSQFVNFIPLILIGFALVGYGLNKNKTKELFTETLVNIGMFIGFQLFSRGATELNKSAFLKLKGYSASNIEETIIVFLCTFLLVDFTYYWVHRLSHKSGFFWSMHSVHHSSREFNFSTALRLSWLSPYINWLFYVPLVLLGVPLKFIFISHVANLWFQFFIHTQMIDKLGILDHILNTPANHRVHHSSQPMYIDKNFGGVFMFWDKLFGTYAPETERVKRYGITGEEIGSYNPVVVNLKPVSKYIIGQFLKLKGRQLS
jgi:sterol desaturase/sphingolipid hydroxylase (fatty acid hydroxylase superfamily)